MIRRHSGSATEPSAFVGSPSSTTRCMPSGWRSVKERVTPTTIPASFIAGARSTGTRWPSASRSCSTNSPRGIAARAIGPLRREHLDQLGRVHGAAAAGLHDPPRALVSGCSGRVGRLVDLDDHAAAGGREEPQLALAASRRRAGRACGRG